MKILKKSKIINIFFAALIILSYLTGCSREKESDLPPNMGSLTLSLTSTTVYLKAPFKATLYSGTELAGSIPKGSTLSNGSATILFQNIDPNTKNKEIQTTFKNGKYKIFILIDDNNNGTYEINEQSFAGDINIKDETTLKVNQHNLSGTISETVTAKGKIPDGWALSCTWVLPDGNPNINTQKFSSSKTYHNKFLKGFVKTDNNKPLIPEISYDLYCTADKTIRKDFIKDGYIGIINNVKAEGKGIIIPLFNTLPKLSKEDKACCEPEKYSIGGLVNSLKGSGLILQNKEEYLPVIKSGPFKFPTPLNDNETYSITASTQPSNPDQTCKAINGTGIVSGYHITNIKINCKSDSYYIGGIVNGLVGSGLMIKGRIKDVEIPQKQESLLKGIVNFKQVNIRNNPNINSEVLTSLTKGTNVKVHNEEKEEWVKVSVKLNYTGWIKGKFLELKENTIEPNEGNKTAYIRIPYINMRKGPGVDTSVLTTLKKGDPVKLISPLKKGWVNLSVDIKYEGWISKNFLDISQDETKQNIKTVKKSIIETLSINKEGKFSFSKPFKDGKSYSVIISHQPANSKQTCKIINSEGIISGKNITNIIINCFFEPKFKINLTVTGLLGNGMILQNNSNDNLPVSSNGAITFPKELYNGDKYHIKIVASPANPKQKCSIINGIGIISNANVFNISIACTIENFSVGGIVEGLKGSGLLLKIYKRNKNVYYPTSFMEGTINSKRLNIRSGTGDNFPVLTTLNKDDDVKVYFPEKDGWSKISKNINYNGWMLGKFLDIKEEQIKSPKHKKIGTVNFRRVNIRAGPGKNYNVLTSLKKGDIVEVFSLNKEDWYKVSQSRDYNGWVVSKYLSIKDNKKRKSISIEKQGTKEDLSIRADGAFAFSTKFNEDDIFSVIISTQPASPKQKCTIKNGNGNIKKEDFSNIILECKIIEHTLGVTVKGLMGQGLVLQNNKENNLPVLSNGDFTFSLPITEEENYAVSVFNQPVNPNQTCYIKNGFGVVLDKDINNVNVTCVTNRYTIGGTVQGLKGTGLVVRNNDGDDINVLSDGAIKFSLPLESGDDFIVTIYDKPSKPNQTCTITNEKGKVQNKNIENILIKCVTIDYSISGVISGLAGSGLILKNNNINEFPVTTNGSFTFPSRLTEAAVYSVKIFTSPSNPNQLCKITNGEGIVPGKDVSDISIECVTDNDLPVVTATVPPAEAEKLPDINIIAATFSEKMDLKTITESTFFLDNSIKGSVIYRNNTAIFIPSGFFDYSKKYTATITKDVKDLAGNMLADNYSWTFTVPAQKEKMVIAKGTSYIIEIKKDHTLWSQGNNTHGQLGDGTLIEKTEPVQIGKDDDWKVVSAGSFHSLALKNNGTLWAWGGWWSGQTGSEMGDKIQTSPVQIGDDNDWVQISAGWFHNLALKDNGTLWAWGANGTGQLGDNTFANKSEPVQIGTDKNWSTIAAGWFHTLALKTDGTLWSWGANGAGQLGDGTNENKKNPTRVGTDNNWLAISAGDSNTLAIKLDGSLWSWGWSMYDKLKDGMIIDELNPTKVGSYEDWKAIDDSMDHKLLLKTRNFFIKEK